MYIYDTYTYEEFSREFVKLTMYEGGVQIVDREDNLHVMGFSNKGNIKFDNFEYPDVNPINTCSFLQGQNCMHYNSDPDEYEVHALFRISEKLRKFKDSKEINELKALSSVLV